MNKNEEIVKKKTGQLREIRQRDFFLKKRFDSKQ